MNYDLAIYIGRFQPVHHGHLDSMKQALEKAKFLLILIGSADISRTEKNPFTVEERQKLIINALESYSTISKEQLEKRVIWASIDDDPDDEIWKKDVKKAVENAEEWIQKQTDQSSLKTAIIGYQKDESSYYLNIFPSIHWLPFDAYLHEGKVLSATDIRKAMKEKRWIDVKKYVEPSSYQWLKDFTF